MRTALSRLQQTIHPRCSGTPGHRCLPCLVGSVPPCHTRHVGWPLRSFHSTPTRSLDRTRPNEPIPFLEQSFPSSNAGFKNGQKRSTAKEFRVAPARRKDPRAWIELLSQLVPDRERSLHQQDMKKESRSMTIDKQSACEHILVILETARKQQHAGVDLLAHMIIHGQQKAALEIIKLLLDDIAGSFPHRSHGTLPSNIQWPDGTLNDMCREPIDARAPLSHPSKRVLHWDQKLDDPRYTFILSETKVMTMTEVWSTLGSLVVSSADLSTEKANEINNALLLILGQIHNLDLVPESVYTYRRSTLSASVRKPPILHLVSSRILTALSDATWRRQQDLMIEKAASHGIPYEEIGKNPPGGRFRLRVRPLSAEIWLEFILWCCVEGGFTSAGARILRNIGSQTENPWFAVTWSPVTSRSLPTPAIDWQRVRARYGGSVGMKEGYSGDKPFVEMPSRTISTEVVLGLVDASINTVNTGAAGGGVEVVQRAVTDMITFLEPHDLPSNYFHCLAVRLMQTDAFNLPTDAHTLHMWYKRLVRMKSLDAVQNHPRFMASFDLESLSAHSEADAGILHQILDAYVQTGDVHRALATFNDLQELVDSSKLQAIASFLNDTSMRPQPGFFCGRPRHAELHDFVGSHGQLPIYRLTGLLDLTTDTGLTGLGRWLLQNNGPDGPLIHEAAYENPGLWRPLIRFASLDRDDALVRKVLQTQAQARRRPTVALLHALVNINIVTLNFNQAMTQLHNLTRARGGGFALSNFVQLAATILKLEAGHVFNMSRANRNEALGQAFDLLIRMLNGSLNERTGLYKREARRSFSQKIGAMLHVFSTCPDSRLSHIAADHASNYPAPNRPCLTPMIFNLFLEAAIESKGAKEGVRLWDHLCQPSGPGEGISENCFFADDDFTTAGRDTEDLDPWSEEDETADHDARYVQQVVLGPPPNPGTLESQHVEMEHLSSELPNAFFTPLCQPESKEADLTPYPVVVPNQRTLRLIVRKAVQERREALDSHGNAALPRQILDWAAQELRRFGATSKMISVELEEPIKQSKIRQFDENLIQSQPWRDRPEKRVGVVRTVESMFKGQERSRAVAK